MKEGAQSALRTMGFRDEEGHIHTNSVDRDAANNKIQERKDNS